MTGIKRPTVAALFLLLSLAATTAAQQKRQTTPKQQPKPAAAPTPAPTFETLLPDSYTIYAEVRGVGQLIQSSSFNDILEPVLKLAAPPKEFKAAVQWLNAHAEEVMTSRLLVAAWPTASEVPSAIVAIEFASAEEATKFAKPLNEMLPTVLPPRHAPDSSAEQGVIDRREKPEAPAPPIPSFHLQQVGSLVLISSTPLTMRQLKPAGSKLLSDDANFRAARNRFNSEPLFVFVNIKAVRNQAEARQKQHEEEMKAADDQLIKQKVAQIEEWNKAEEPAEPELTPEQRAAMEQEMAELEAEVSVEPPKEEPSPNPLSIGMSMIASSLFRLESKWPEGVGLALSFENDSFDLRALLVNQAGEQSDVVPFLPVLMPGPAFTPESPNIFPADTELFVTMSLDLPQIYSAMSTPRPSAVLHASSEDPAAPAGVGGHSKFTLTEVVKDVSPFAAIEKQLKIKIKDDLLPLLGSEIAVRLPVNDFSFLGFAVLPGARPQGDSAKQQSSKTSPAVAISLKDKEAVRALLPKIVEAAAFKGANAFAQTERKEDTELVSYANLFSYAFIGNFLVLSGDPATTRHIVDSYLKHETLSSDTHFRTSTRWQPRPAYGQVYISPALMEGYKTWFDKPRNKVSDQAKAILTRFISVAHPITYSLSNEGIGPLHEVHLPKNLVLMMIAGMAADSNPPPALQNERKAVAMMYTISYAQEHFKKGKGAGNYGTLEQLFSENVVSKEMVESSGYKVEMTVSGDKFEVTAVPVEYGKTGSMSYFIDETGVLRSADRSGASATKDDPQIN